MTKVDSPEIQRPLKIFWSLMEQKLRENEHKGGWAGDSPISLWKRLREEANELMAEIVAGSEIDPQEIAREAADVANFAMMIADVCGGLALAQTGGAMRRRNGEWINDRGGIGTSHTATARHSASGTNAGTERGSLPGRSVLPAPEGPYPCG